MDVTVEFHLGISAALVSSAHTMDGSAWIVVLTKVSRLKVDFVVVALPSPVIGFACRFMFKLLFFFRRSGAKKR
jgi:hypothetical protein